MKKYTSQYIACPKEKMLMDDQATKQRVYLLTVWCTQSVAVKQITLRFSLEDPRTGERFNFGAIEELEGKLKEQFQVKSFDDE